MCQQGWISVCDNFMPSIQTDPVSDISGMNLNKMVGLGTFAEFSIVPQSSIVKIEKDVPFPQAALIGCGVTTGVSAVTNAANVRPGTSVAVFGCGGVGLSTILASKAKKLSPIIGIDVNKKKLKIAKKFGANKTFIFKEKNFIIKLKRYCKSDFPIIIECTGKIEVLKFCINIANNFGGKILVIGNYPKPSNIKFDPWNIIKGKTLMGAWNDKNLFDQKMEFFKKKMHKGYHTNFFGSKVYKLDEINLAINDFKKGKVVRPLIKFN